MSMIDHTIEAESVFSQSPLTRRIRIRASAGWSDMPSVCLLVSCGKEAHEDANFAAAMAKMHEAGKPILIDLADTLQRYNLMAAGMDAQTAYEQSLMMGESWIARHRFMIGNAQVLRWDTRLAHPDFKAVHERIWELYETDSLFAQAVAADMALFLKRQENPTEHLADCSRRFLLEETASYILLGREMPCARLYPGKELETTRVLRTGLIANAPLGLERTSYYSFSLESVKGIQGGPAADERKQAA